MSFEMKYDRNGNPIPQKLEQQPEPATAPQLEETPVMEPMGDAALSNMLSGEEQDAPERVEQVKEVPQQKFTQQQQPVEEEPDGHFSRLRKKALQAEKERDELARRVAELEAQYAKSQHPAQVDDHDHDDDEELSVGTDDLVEGKHLRQVDKKMRKMQQQLAAYQQQIQMNATEVRLKNQFPDFDKVVSRDNIETLRLAYPEIATTLEGAPDLYNKAVSAYTLIKQFGIHKEDHYARDREIAQRNAAKPRTLSTISPQQGDTPLSRANAFANGLTDDLKKQLHKEMMESMRNR